MVRQKGCREETGHDCGVIASVAVATLLLPAAMALAQIPKAKAKFARPDVTKGVPLDALSKVDPERLTKVPPLKGLREEQLGRTLEAARLNLGAVDRAYDANYPEGEVSGQSLDAGLTVLRWEKVDVTLSRGPEPGAAAAVTEQPTAVPTIEQPVAVPTIEQPAAVPTGVAPPEEAPVKPAVTKKVPRFPQPGVSWEVIAAVLAAVVLVGEGYRRLARRLKRQKDKKHKATPEPDIRAVTHDDKLRLTGEPARGAGVGLVVRLDNEGRQSVRLHESQERGGKE